MFGLFTKKAQRQPRKYQVPEGLVDRVIELLEKIETDSSPRVARRALWKLLEERCPEVADGSWSIVQDGPRVYLRERLPA